MKKNALIALLCALAVTLAAGVGAFRRVDKWVQDALLQRPGAASPEIVIIGIDEDTLSALGPYHTWSRAVMASALERLAEDPDHLPAVVAVDTLYAGTSDPEADARLVEAARRLPAVVMASAAQIGAAYGDVEETGVTVDAFSVLGYETPYDALRDVTAQGHINAMYDRDGVMRHALLYVDVPMETGVRRVYSMACEAARLYREAQGATLKTPRTDARGFFYIPFTAAPGGYDDGYSLARLIRGEVPSDAFAGKIVLIGPYAAALQDAYFTPIDRSRQMYGVEVQANVIQSLLEGNEKTELGELPQLAALFLLCFGAALVFLRGKVGRTAWLALALIVLGPAAAWALYALGTVTHPLWLPLGALLLYIAAVARHYALAAMERQRVTRTFERYVAPEIVREILREGTDSLKLGGSLRQIAVLFVDIRGFTAMSERLAPERVVYILNKYLDMTSACVEKNGGTLDKYVGDATMAFWGAPLPIGDPVVPAARAAMDIIAGARALSRQLREELGEELNVGVGIHYGPAVVGNMGSERRMDYTAIGDTVNTAARLESNAPGGVIYISRAVADRLGNRARTTSLGAAVRLKGKAEGFEVLTLDQLT